MDTSLSANILVILASSPGVSVNFNTTTGDLTIGFAGTNSFTDIVENLDGRYLSTSGGINLSCSCSLSSDYGNLCFDGSNFKGCKGYDDPDDSPDLGTNAKWFKLDTFGN